MFDYTLSALALISAITLLYLWIKRKQNYWRVRNVPNEPNFLSFFKNREHIAYYLQRIYQRFKPTGAPFVGLHILFSPAVLVLDLDLVKRIFISDFESFPDRGFYHNVVDDPLSGNIFRLEGETWRQLRTKLTPTFSSGKMKYMFPTLKAVGERFVAVVGELLGVQSVDFFAGAEIQIRDLCARYTTDVIGSVAFGIECNSLREPRTEFRIKGDKAFGESNPILEFLTMKYPQLMRRLHVKAFPKELIEFYTRIVSENITYREQHGVRRNDFLDILLELRKAKLDGDVRLSMEEIVAQAFVFFIGGFETSSSTMTFCLFELSQQPEIQERTRRDIFEALERHENMLTYECLQEMKYLQQVFMETLRKHPVAPSNRRFTRRDYPIPGTTYTLPAGMQVIIPVYAIHHDPAYFPAPEKFDPERFATTTLNDEHPQRHAMSYIPFGAGPRNCIAERFGKMQTLIGLASLLCHYKFTTCSRTPTQLEFDSVKRIFSVKGGQLWLKVEKVQQR